MTHTRIVALALILVALLGGCRPRSESEPEPTPLSRPAVAEPSATPAAAVPTEPAAKPTPAPTETPSEPAEPASIEFWTADNQGDRMAAYRAVAQRYMAAHPNVEITIVPVEESTISLRLREAALGGVLPDIARVGLERLPPLLAAGLLDETAADATIDAIGREDFRDGPLAMVTDPESGLASAVPYDGWIQALWYRRDLFEQTGIESPVTWEQINVACDVISGLDAYPLCADAAHRPAAELCASGLRAGRHVQQRLAL